MRPTARAAMSLLRPRYSAPIRAPGTATKMAISWLYKRSCIDGALATPSATVSLYEVTPPRSPTNRSPNHAP